MNTLFDFLQNHLSVLLFLGIFSITTGVIAYFATGKIYPIIRQKIIDGRINIVIGLNKIFSKNKRMKEDYNEINWNPFQISGWHKWGGIQVNDISENTILVNENVELGGCVSIETDTSLGGKILKMNFENTSESVFCNGGMLKLTCNSNDQCIKPNNIPYLISNEYIPCGDHTAYYTIPKNFDGKIGFTFYMAELINLKISAFCS